MLEIESLEQYRDELRANIRALMRDQHVLLGLKMMAEMPEGHRVFFRGWLERAEANYRAELPRIRRMGLQAYYRELYEKQRLALESVK